MYDKYGLSQVVVRGTCCQVQGSDSQLATEQRPLASLTGTQQRSGGTLGLKNKVSQPCATVCT